MAFDVICRLLFVSVLALSILGGSAVEASQKNIFSLLNDVENTVRRALGDGFPLYPTHTNPNEDTVECFEEVADPEDLIIYGTDNIHMNYNGTYTDFTLILGGGTSVSDASGLQVGSQIMAGGNIVKIICRVARKLSDEAIDAVRAALRARRLHYEDQLVKLQERLRLNPNNRYLRKAVCVSQFMVTCMGTWPFGHGNEPDVIRHERECLEEAYRACADA